MSQESLEQFRQVVLEDSTLQEQLRGTPDQETFLALVVRAGAERGYTFNSEEVRESLRASRRAWFERWI